MLRSQTLQAAKISVSCSTSHLYGKAYEPVRQQTAAIHEEVHHVCVIGVLHPAQTRFNHSEPGLHKHDQEACDQCPDKVDSNLVLTDLIGDITGRQSSFSIR